jgi:hypothetical protein
MFNERVLQKRAGGSTLKNKGLQAAGETEITEHRRWEYL